MPLTKRVLRRTAPYKIVPREETWSEPDDRPEFYFTMRFLYREDEEPIFGADIACFIRRQDQNCFAKVIDYDTDEKGEVHIPLHGDGFDYSAEVVEVCMTFPLGNPRLEGRALEEAIDNYEVPVMFSQAVHRRLHNREILTFRIKREDINGSANQES
jgi:hypothetical protein